MRAQARNSDSNLGRLGPGPAIQRLAPLDPVREFPDMPRRSRTRPGSTEPGLGSRPRADCFFSHFTCEGELGGIQRVPNPSCPAFPGSPAGQRREAIGFPQATTLITKTLKPGEEVLPPPQTTRLLHPPDRHGRWGLFYGTKSTSTSTSAQALALALAA